MKNAFVAVFFVWLTISTSRADTWQRAEVYFIDWSVLTRVALSPERVRELADYKHTVRNDAPAVARLLELTKLKPSKDNRPEDARLVIDLLDDTMQGHTYYASRFNLCSANNKRKRAMDEQFRQRLSPRQTTPDQISDTPYKDAAANVLQHVAELIR
jgi:hypothetical protein